MTVDWARVHDEFPVNRELVWLNNCGTTPTPGPVLAALGRWLAAYADRGVFAEERTYPGVLRSIQTRLATLVRGAPEDVVPIHNTAEGMLFVSHGLDLRPGERVLVLENEYPSNVYPWEHLCDRGVEVEPVPVGHSPAEFLESFRAAVAKKGARVASLSAVHWCTGMPLPLEAVGRLCEEHGVEFVVDGSQGVGLVPIDVEAMRIGFMAFAAWKWLMGPLGLGAFYVRPDKLDKLRFTWKGAGSVVDDERYLPYRATLKGVERYVFSTCNFNDWVYFDTSLAYLEGLGFEAVRLRILELAARLSDGLRRLGFRVASDAFPGARTGIVVAHKAGVDTAALVTELRQRGIVAAERLGRLRLAPHVYLSEAQIDRTIATLAELAPS